MSDFVRLLLKFSKHNNNNNKNNNNNSPTLTDSFY